MHIDILKLISHLLFWQITINDIFGILKGYLDDIHNSEYFDNSMQIDSALDHLSKFANKDYKHVSI